MPLFTPAGVDLNMLMPVVADDAIPITKVLSHVVVSVKHYRGLLKSDQEIHFLFKNSKFLSED